jgi:metallophosphoesterase (TIGR00282 family)
MKLLLVGDIVGSPGRAAFKRAVADLKANQGADVVVANAENAAGGRGVTAAIARELFEAGADVLTMGDHAWDQRELQVFIQGERRLLRPANFAPGAPGQGSVVIDTAWGQVAVLCLVGRVFMKPYDCPFRAADGLLESLPPACGVRVVDFHAEATSEKVAMGRYLDGRVTCVAGTHTHVQTSDETVLPGGTAYITDLGMTGPRASVLGMDPATVLPTFVTGMPRTFKVASGPTVMEGMQVEVDRQTGKAKSVMRVRCELA